MVFKVETVGNGISPEGAVEVRLKLKHRAPKQRGRYSGGERAAPKKRRNKDARAAKLHKKDQWSLHVKADGKKVMVKNYE